MSVQKPRDEFDETKNWGLVLQQKGKPRQGNDINIAEQNRALHIRREIAELIGNGSSNAGFLLSGSVTNPVISDGNIYVAGLKIEIPSALTETTQPNGTQTPLAGNGIWYLEIELLEITSAE